MNHLYIQSKQETPKKKNKQSQLKDVSIQNFDGFLDIDEEDVNFVQNDFRLPQHPFNMIIAGKTNCGKGNLLQNMIMRFCNFKKLYIYAKQIHQEKYKQIEKAFEEIPEQLVMSNDWNDIIGVQELDGLQSLIIIDDFVSTPEAQTKIIDLWISARHGNASCIYLTQMYTKVPRPIRLNTHYFAIYKTGNRKENLLLYLEIGIGKTKEEFIKILDNATSGRYNFLLVDHKTAHDCMEYRQNFDGMLTNN
jgi:hypothetical protein